MSSKNVGKPLTADLVFTKTKSDSLHNIKNLNLWGNDLEDLQLIQKMPNLEVVSLSVNRISSLKDFAYCPKLQELYLRKNSIADLREIRHLVKLPTLKVLWLHDNPCAQTPNYREIVIKHLPNLVKLDNYQVTPEEKQNSLSVDFEIASQEQGYAEEQFVGGGGGNYEEQKWQRPSSGYGQKPQRSQQSVQQPEPRSAYREEPSNSSQHEERQRWGRNPAPKKQQQSHYAREEDINRNQNILMAVLSLMRELDPGSLEIVKREADKLLH